jgi:hypothetical protein
MLKIVSLLRSSIVLPNMSYIRLSSQGRYCDLGEGSYVYAFGTGSGQIINQGIGDSVRSEKFAKAILEVFESVGVRSKNLQDSLSEEFGGVADNIDGFPYPEPEMGEVACRVVFDRLNVEGVSESAAQDIASKFTPTYTGCENCGKDTRVVGGRPKNDIFCDKDQCREARDQRMDEKLASQLGYDSVEEYRDDELDF